MNLIEYFKDTPFTEILSPLTPKEKQIIELVAQGYSYQEVEEILKIAKSTLKTHLTNIGIKIKPEEVKDLKTTICLFWQVYKNELKSAKSKIQ